MATYILSDLHIQDRAEDFLFNHAKEEIFLKLADEILSDRHGQLIFAGDVFDLTSMMPPTKGLTEFFAEVLTPEQFTRAMVKPEFEKLFRPRSTPELLAAIKREYPLFFEVLTKLGVQKKLTLVIGNHDCPFLDLEGQRALTDCLGLAPEQIKWSKSMLLGSFYLATHGHEYDKPNNTDRGCMNAGWAITSALYCAVGPALREMGVDAAVVAALPAVRPEEEIVSGIGNYLGEQKTKAFLIAFVKLLERNGYFRHGVQFIMWFLVHSVPPFSWLVRAGVTPKRVRKSMPSEDSLKQMGRNGAAQIHREHPACTVIMGHTHALDFTPNYVNLGTWIDHVNGLAPTQLKAVDSTLPVFRIEDESDQTRAKAGVNAESVKSAGADGALYDARNLKEVSGLTECPRLWPMPLGR